MKSKVSNWTGKFKVYVLGLPYSLCSTNGLENRRKILAVSTQLKQLRTNCEDLSYIFIFHPQFEYMFHISTFTNGPATKSGKGVLGISTNRVLCFRFRCWNKLNQHVILFNFLSKAGLE